MSDRLTDQQIVDHEAASTKVNLIAAVQPGADEPITKGDVYDHVERLRCYRYMIGGGGPTTHATCMTDSDGDVTVLITSHGQPNCLAHEVITGRDAVNIAFALAKAAQEGGMLGRLGPIQ